MLSIDTIIEDDGVGLLDALLGSCVVLLASLISKIEVPKEYKSSAAKEVFYQQYKQLFSTNRVSGLPAEYAALKVRMLEILCNGLDDAELLPVALGYRESFGELDLEKLATLLEYHMTSHCPN